MQHEKSRFIAPIYIGANTLFCASEMDYEKHMRRVNVGRVVVVLDSNGSSGKGSELSI